MKRSERKFAAVASNIQNGIAAIVFENEKPSLVFANPALLEMMGLGFADFARMINSKDSQLILEADKPKCKELFETLLDLKPARSQIRHLIAGKVRWLTLSGVAVQEGNRKIAYITAQDDTAVNEYEEELLFQHRLSDSAIGLSNLYYFAYDSTRHRASISEKAQKKFDTSPIYEPFPQSFFDIGIVFSEDVKTFRDAFLRIDGGSDQEEFDARIRLAGKSVWIWMHFCCAKVGEDSNHDLIYTCAVEDIDEKKRLEDRIITILTQNRIVSWRYDITGDAIEPTDVKLTNWIPGESTGREVCHPDDIKVLDEMKADIVNGKGTVSGIVRFMMENETVYSRYRIIITEITSSDNPVRIAIGSAIDVSAEMQARDAFDNAVIAQNPESVQWLRGKAVANINRNFISVWDPDVPGSASLDDKFGKNYDQEIERWQSIPIAYPPGSTARMDAFTRENVLKVFRESGVRQISVTYLRHFDDGNRWIKTEMVLVGNGVTGDLEGYFYPIDVDSEIKQKQALQTIADSTYDFIRFLDENFKIGHVIMGSRAMSPDRCEGLAFEELVEQMVSSHVRPEDEGEYRKHMNPDFILASIKNSPDNNCTFVLPLWIDGHRRWKRYSFSWADQTMTSIIMERLDVTEVVKKQEEAQAALSKALEEASSANAAKSSFLSNMSHDIRTPMNAIVNLAEMLESDIGDRNELELDIQRLQSSSHYMLGLVNDILDLSRIENGRLSFHPGLYRFTEFYDSLTGVIEPLCNAKGIHFIFTKGDGFPPSVMVDRKRFNQVFFNLLSNAVNYTDNGGTVLLEMLLKDPQDSQAGSVAAVFIVRDTGIGMSYEFQKKMFEPFERENTTSGAPVGTGLGLSLAKAVVDSMKGTIAVRSEKGKGTEFTVTLRLDLPTEEQIRASEVSDSSYDPAILSGKRILVCEDNEINGMIITRLLRNIGMECRVVGDGKAGVDVFEASRKGEFDAILMDIRMPVMDGLAAAEAIRNLPRPDARTIPIIALSANAFEEDVKKSLDAGMNDHLAKPVEPESLYACLAKCWCRRS
ncbi:MAG: ATP-binding protein [Sphaerochaetaceae bacterium]|nr:ATP-binding protein [Sphaerochaetaceae bacterium]